MSSHARQGARLGAARVAGLLLLLAGGGLWLGWSFERGVRPPLARDHHAEGTGRLRLGELAELEDRAVRLIRSGASEVEIDRALRRIQDAGATSPRSKDRLVEKRAAWWRDRIGESWPEHLEATAAVARRIGFTDDELDLDLRSFDRELVLLERICDPTREPRSAQDWASALARQPLSHEAAGRARALLADRSTPHREALMLGMRGTPRPEISAALWGRAKDAREAPALRRAAAQHVLDMRPLHARNPCRRPGSAVPSREEQAALRATHVEEAFALLLEAATPVEMRRDLVRLLSRELRDDGAETFRALAAQDSAGRGLVLLAASTHHVVPRDALRTAVQDAATDDALRAQAIGRFAWLRGTTSEDLELLESLAGDPAEPERVRRAARGALRAVRSAR
jgi:hypothetical protein